MGRILIDVAIADVEGVINAFTEKCIPEHLVDPYRKLLAELLQKKVAGQLTVTAKEIDARKFLG